MYGFSRRMGLNGKREDEKGKMQTVGLEPTRANTLRPERSTLDHSVTFASVCCFLTALMRVFSVTCLIGRIAAAQSRICMLVHCYSILC